MDRENRIDLVNSANRRGLLLGLTLSEIMMIILFALLLLFGVVFAEQEKDRQRLAELEVQAREGETALAALTPMREVLNTLGIDAHQVEEILREMRLAQDLRREIEMLKDQVSELAPLSDPEAKRKLEEAQRQLSQKQAELANAEKKIAELEQELQAIGQKQRDAARLANAMAEAGMTPEQARQAERSIAAINHVLDGMRQQMGKAGMDPKAIQAAIERTTRDWAETAMDNRAKTEQVNYWKGKYEADIGKGKYASPCWSTNGQVDPIYDVALTDDGIMMRRFEVPQWAGHYDQLPTESVRLMQLVSQSEFLNSTRPLFNYSNKKECRFFVRLYDETSVNAKLVYQQRRRAVEGHFYIIDMKNAKFADGN